jgi:hypothetical protein
MMSKEAAEKVPVDVFKEYRRKFGVMDTFAMPDDMTAERLTFLMQQALQEGKEIDYEKEGWLPDSPDILT